MGVGFTTWVFWGYFLPSLLFYHMYNFFYNNLNSVKLILVFDFADIFKLM